jgi:hypothetical protein
MTDATRMLVSDARTQCLAKVDGLRGTGTLAEAFAAWVLGNQYADHLQLHAAAMESATKLGAQRSYRDVAILAYAIAVSPDDGELRQPLLGGLNWLCGRKPFPQSGVSFEVDGLALLGIAMGAHALGLSSVPQWIASFLQKSASSRVAALDQACIAATAATIEHSHLAPMPTSEEFADFRLAFHSRGLDVKPMTGDDGLALKHVLHSAPSDLGEPECAVHVRVLDWVIKEACDVNLSHAAVEDLLRILERVPAALKRWRWDTEPIRGRPPVQWQIDDEYHVQDLLWIILAPVFPDLEDEENLPSVGHKHPRYDLGVPSLHTIVEVKFIRRKADFAKVTEEIAADHTLYLRAGSSYNKIVAFIWDDSASSDQHAELRQAFAKMPGIAGSIIVARPARMKKR